MIMDTDVKENQHITTQYKLNCFEETSNIFVFPISLFLFKYIGFITRRVKILTSWQLTKNSVGNYSLHNFEKNDYSVTCSTTCN